MINRALKLARQFHRLSQTEVAARLEISKSFLSELEAGKKPPSLELLQRYAKVFGIPASTLMTFAEGFDNTATTGRRAQAEKVLRFLEWAARDEDPGDAAA